MKVKNQIFPTPEVIILRVIYKCKEIKNNQDDCHSEEMRHSVFMTENKKIKTFVSHDDKTIVFFARVFTIFKSAKRM